MAVSHIADASAVGSNSAATVDSGNVTVSSGDSNRALIAFLMLRDRTATVSSVIYDPGATNQTMTFLGSAQPSTSNVIVRAYGLLNPSAAVSKPIRATWDNLTECSIVGTYLAGVDQDSLATSMIVRATATGNDTAPTVAITSQTNNLTVDGLVTDSATASLSNPGTSQTTIGIDNGRTNDALAAGWKLGSASNTHVWTASATAQWAELPIDVVAVGQAGGSAPTFIPRYRLMSNLARYAKTKKRRPC